MAYHTFRVELAPRKFSRMINHKSGLKLPHPNPPVVEPTPFDKERADEIIRVTKLKHRKRGFEWSSGICNQMTDGELCFVAIVWDSMRGSTCWMDAFYRVQEESVGWWWKPDPEPQTNKKEKK